MLCGYYHVFKDALYVDKLKCNNLPSAACIVLNVEISSKIPFSWEDYAKCSQFLQNNKNLVIEKIFASRHKIGRKC